MVPSMHGSSSVRRVGDRRGFWGRGTGVTTQPSGVRVGMIGLGSMARAHLGDVLDAGNAEVVAICEPSDDAMARASAVFGARGMPQPPNEPDWRPFLDRYAAELDAVLIVTPHVLHFAQ